MIFVHGHSFLTRILSGVMCKQPISYFSGVFHLVLCKVLQAALLIIFKATAGSVAASSSCLHLQVDRLKRLLTLLQTVKTVHVTRVKLMISHGAGQLLGTEEGDRRRLSLEALPFV